MRRFLHFIVLVVLLGGLFQPALAVLPDEILPDPALEARARALSTQLRCLVCQNETIDDSGAELARDLRLLVRERLVSGDSDRQVLDFIVARYGDYVLLKPRFSGRTLLLWISPLLLLVVGAGYILFAACRRKNMALPPLTPAEERQLEALLYDVDTKVKDSS